MPVTVQGKLVSVLIYLADKLWVVLSACSDQVECRTHPVLIQHIQQPRRILGVRTIVKSQGDPVAQSSALKEDFRVAALGRLIDVVQEGGWHIQHAAFQLYDIYCEIYA